MVKSSKFAIRKLMNANFRVKIHGLGFHCLCGFSLLESLIGLELSIKAVERALNCPLDKCTVKYRRGLKIDFYVK